MKNIVLIRHGESLGQTARARGVSRQRDDSLTDCFLSQKGIQQAYDLRGEISDLHNEYKFELICMSPLTRAVATCVLGLGHLSEQRAAEEQEGQGEAVPFLCHPDLAETGGRIPENQGRPIKKVVKDIEQKLCHFPSTYEAVNDIDFSLLPSSWPRHQGEVAYFMEWLGTRMETSIAIVCHHNVIQALLGYACERIPNCVPLQCIMIDGDFRSLHLRSASATGGVSQEKLEGQTNKPMALGRKGRRGRKKN
mmetsp:Transcript_15951/g.20247  ORF Transcript_15951/g.20247 Transcript_15951/m.20247 type:complete len:251 (+) Transcript_15951:75-827(+)